MNQKADANHMRPEYDFSGGIRGKHYKAYQDDTNVVLLEPDVARVFSDSASVNQALRMLTFNIRDFEEGKTRFGIETLTPGEFEEKYLL